MMIEWGEFEFIGEFIEQAVSIVDTKTGIKWFGSAKSLVNLDNHIPANEIINIVKNAIAHAKKGVDGVRIYKYNEAKIHVELKRNDSFLNASSIKMRVSVNGKNVYCMELDPKI